MTATFQPAGGSVVTLAGSDTSGWFDQPTGIDMEGDFIVQHSPRIRANTAIRFGRQNYTRAISFTVHKSYDTFDLAVAGNIALLTSIQGIGEFLLKNAAGTTIMTIANAKCTCRCSDGGAFAIRRFTVEGSIA